MLTASVRGSGLSLSQVQNWDIHHLYNASEHWNAVAGLSTYVFTAVYEGALSPGGTVWEGVAAEAAQQRCHGDLIKVRALADALKDAANQARWGAADLQHAQQSVLMAVRDAQLAGFQVLEDLSIIEVNIFSAEAKAAGRRTQAQALAAEIEARAMALKSLDQEVAAKIQISTTPLQSIGFEESLGEDRIQTVGNVFKEGPPLPESPWEYNNGYTTTVTARGPDGKTVDGGSLVSLDEVWNELHRCFNCNFPIGGAPKEFPEVGDELPLEMKIGGIKAANLPVKVMQINRTLDAIDIEFATLPGHADGPGSTIHFRWTEQAGAPHLDIRGYITEGPGSGDGPFAAPTRVGYTALAKAVWQPYIDNIVTHVVQSKGYEALPTRLIGGH